MVKSKGVAARRVARPSTIKSEQMTSAPKVPARLRVDPIPSGSGKELERFDQF